ncbi:hypothetical protein FQA47_012303 [Oryzias melastigma]|uniref:Uncharacterized protein n=1 Tax=Oryzias melastigma TaxID=30732 RepID=A0A834C901_ORYME|nr:hypothetical protein FQA47_012303 [Oryzias melastigma]
MKYESALAGLPYLYCSSDPPRLTSLAHGPVRCARSHPAGPVWFWFRELPAFCPLRVSRAPQIGLIKRRPPGNHHDLQTGTAVRVTLRSCCAAAPPRPPSSPGAGVCPCGAEEEAVCILSCSCTALHRDGFCGVNSSGFFLHVSLSGGLSR